MWGKIYFYWRGGGRDLDYFRGTHGGTSSYGGGGAFLKEGGGGEP